MQLLQGQGTAEEALPGPDEIPNVGKAADVGRGLPTNVGTVPINVLRGANIIGPPAPSIKLDRKASKAAKRFFCSSSFLRTLVAADCRCDSLIDASCAGVIPDERIKFA